MFTLVVLNRFKKDFKKLVKNNNKLKSKVEKTLVLLEDDPQQKSLGSHKVSLSLYGEV
jgi:mRNA-degrading endonuclease YafQ of YafQ-DinJ toxin-antitoxin module